MSDEATGADVGAAPTPAAPSPAQEPTPASSPTTDPTPEMMPPATPEATARVPAAPDPGGEEFVAALPQDFETALAEELERLAEISEEWNPDAQVSIAVVLPDESIHGYRARETRISASAVKPLWTAAALQAAGVEAVAPLANDVVILSDNSAGGRMIDLAGGVDAVNAWTWDVAELSDTRLEAWRFDDPDRVARDFRPENPLGNRTTAADLAHFYARLHQGELLGPDETAVLQGWLLDTSHTVGSPRDLDGVLVDRLPSEVAASALHKAGWLRPNCCPADYRQMIDAGLVVLPDGGWYAVAIVTARGEFFDLSNQWVSLASCRIYSLVADDPDLVCEGEEDGVHDPEIWPEPASDAQS
ncbi:serine hydrolase [Candidatus Poriferisocius sp.]|uniref:serine hydrolase n=1 Tax=Candidatus Poriferisocius sp. TaxID=3101276 RepID=UPI003B019552